MTDKQIAGCEKNLSKQRTTSSNDTCARISAYSKSSAPSEQNENSVFAIFSVESKSLMNSEYITFLARSNSDRSSPDFFIR